MHTQVLFRKWGPIRCNQWQISKKHKKVNAFNFFNWFFFSIISHFLWVCLAQPLSVSISHSDFWARWDWQNKRDCCGDTNYLMNSLFILKVGDGWRCAQTVTVDGKLQAGRQWVTHEQRQKRRGWVMPSKHAHALQAMATSPMQPEPPTYFHPASVLSVMPHWKFRFFRNNSQNGNQFTSARGRLSTKINANG